MSGRIEKERAYEKAFAQEVVVGGVGDRTCVDL